VESFLKTVLSILVGWGLGLLSPPIVDLIQRRRRRQEIKQGLIIEFEGLRVSLAALTYQLASSRGALTRELIQVVESIFRSDKAFSETTVTAELLRSWLALPDDELERKLRKLGPIPISFKKLSLPYTMTHLSSLSLFSEEFQRLALKVWSRVEILNQEMEFASFFFQKTFDSVSESAHKTIVGNLDRSYVNLMNLSRPLIDDLNALLSLEL
jgi:hypothetical protein